MGEKVKCTFPNLCEKVYVAAMFNKNMRITIGKLWLGGGEVIENGLDFDRWIGKKYQDKRGLLNIVRLVEYFSSVLDTPNV